MTGRDMTMMYYSDNLVLGANHLSYGDSLKWRGTHSHLYSQLKIDYEALSEPHLRKRTTNASLVI